MREQQCLAAHAHSLMVRDVQNLYFRQAILVARTITCKLSKKITKHKLQSMHAFPWKYHMMNDVLIQLA
jgi:hypothetical protein